MTNVQAPAPEQASDMEAREVAQLLEGKLPEHIFLRQISRTLPELELPAESEVDPEQLKLDRLELEERYQAYILEAASPEIAAVRVAGDAVGKSLLRVIVEQPETSKIIGEGDVNLEAWFSLIARAKQAEFTTSRLLVELSLEDWLTDLAGSCSDAVANELGEGDFTTNVGTAVTLVLTTGLATVPSTLAIQQLVDENPRAFAMRVSLMAESLASIVKHIGSLPRPSRIRGVRALLVDADAMMSKSFIN